LVVCVSLYQDLLHKQAAGQQDRSVMRGVSQSGMLNYLKSQVQHTFEPPEIVSG
jgi:hypothetical protein